MTATHDATLRASVDHLLEGVQIIGFDWTYRYLNDAAARQGGRSPEELLGRTMMECYPGIDRTDLFVVLTRVMETRRPETMLNEFQLPDGTRGWFDLVIEPVPEGICVLSLDVTEKRRIEDQLEQQERRVQFALRSTGIGVWDVEFESEAVVWSETLEQIAGLRPGTGPTTLSDFVAYVDARDRDLVRSAIVGAADFNLTFRLVRPDGQARWMEGHGRASAGAGGRATHMLGVAIDITARREADRASRAKTEFLSRMSHELRTPLNAIMGFAQVLQLESLNEEQSEAVKHILRGGRHLLALINEVLDVSRIEGGVLSLSPEPVAIADIVHHAVDLIRPLAAQRNLTVDVEPLPNTYALADRQRLNQILFNLLSNAVKYNRDGGRVRVLSAASDPSRVAIVVEDTGAGIPPGKLALLFTPFERLGAEQSGVEGTGLGLALAKGLAEAMAGSLTVESTVDRGSSFRVELPVATAAAARAETDAVASAAHSASSGIIVYIEDNVSNLMLMQRLVSRRPGVQLLHARDGHTGVALIRDRHPDLVFLDLHLPDCPGEEVLRRIWETPATRDIPVVVLSADATPAQKRRLLAAGATAYLTKPFDIADVLQTIDRTVGTARSEGT